MFSRILNLLDHRWLIVINISVLPFLISYQNAIFAMSYAEKSKKDNKLEQAINNPEYMLKNWINLPTATKYSKEKIKNLTLQEAILLALRYNPNIQNAELDRIIQRYQLRLANNQFEMQYALRGAGAVEKTRYNGVGNAAVNSFVASPEISLKTALGSLLSVKVDNNVPNYYAYTPVLNVTFSQPLLRGFGKRVNEAGLLNAIDNEKLNKLTLQQAIIDQITQVITTYRNLILSGNNLKNQKRQLEEAQKSYKINQAKIKAGELEPTGNIQQAYQIESLNLLVEQADNDFTTASQDLLRVIGLDSAMQVSVPSDVVVDKLIIPNLEESKTIALNNNASYLAQKMLLKADGRAYDLAKNQQMWQLDFIANFQSGRMSDVDANNSGFANIYSGRNTTEAASLTLTVPIEDLERRNQLISAKVQLEKDKINLIAARRDLETNITNIINSIQSQARRYQLAKKQVSLALQSYNLEKKRQRAGISSALDVNNTQNQLIQAQMSLINAKISYLNQMSALQRILGVTLDYWKVKLRYAG